jgi:hypothetical protein
VWKESVEACFRFCSGMYVERRMTIMMAVSPGENLIWELTNTKWRAYHYASDF